MTRLASRAGRRAGTALCCALCCTFIVSACSVTGAHPETGAASAPADVAPAADRSAAAFALSLDADRAYRDKRWEDAVHHYRQLTERVPADAYSWFRLGNSYSRRGAFDRAADAYERSVERDARDPRPWFNLSTAYLLRAQQAMTHAWRAMRPGDPERALIERRLSALGVLMSARVDGAVGTGTVPAPTRWR